VLTAFWDKQHNMLLEVISALCLGLLDCSPKASPPGSVVKRYRFADVSPPGNRGGMPIFSGYVIIRGNLPTPSSLHETDRTVIVG